jgi:hypothetical protein
MITNPYHPEFVCYKITIDKDGHVLPVLEGNVSENVPENVPEKCHCKFH